MHQALARRNRKSRAPKATNLDQQAENAMLKQNEQGRGVGRQGGREGGGAVAGRPVLGSHRPLMYLGILVHEFLQTGPWRDPPTASL